MKLLIFAGVENWRVMVSVMLRPAELSLAYDDCFAIIQACFQRLSLIIGTEISIELAHVCLDLWSYERDQRNLPKSLNRGQFPPSAVPIYIRRRYQECLL